MNKYDKAYVSASIYEDDNYIGYIEIYPNTDSVHFRFINDLYMTNILKLLGRLDYKYKNIFYKE